MIKAEKQKMLQDLYVAMINSIRINAPVRVSSTILVHEEAMKEAKKLLAMFEKDNG